MTITLKLLSSEPEKPEGFPLTFIISHDRKRRKYQIGFCKATHYIKDEEIISRKHPDFDGLYPDIMQYKLKAREILRARPVDVDAVYAALFGKSIPLASFQDMAAAIIKEMKERAAQFEAVHNYARSGALYGNAEALEDALKSFNTFAPGKNFNDIDYPLLLRYREARELAGNTKSTIKMYLTEIRSMYNRIKKMHKIKTDENPFIGIFAGLTVRSHATRKKNVSIEAVRQIEGIVHAVPSMYRWTDLWLLQFYMGGCDLKDIYYLKNAQLKNGRVYFTRSKTNTEVLIDLKLHPKAQVIIDKYKVDGEFLFPWRKDADGYKTFRHKMRTVLMKIQTRYGIELEGEGGNLTLKVARHTFANIGKRLYIEPDLLGELQGHLRGDVDNYYKDRYPQDVRDAALFKVIG